MALKAAIIVCARLKSSRIPRKVATEINGKAILHHLYDRLRQAELPIILAVPEAEFHDFNQITDKFQGPVTLFAGHDDDPLARMEEAARVFGFDAVVRVTHDKIFVDVDQIRPALERFELEGLEYLFSSKFTAGTGFEIISTAALARATEKYKNVEFISYAVRAVATRTLDAYFGSYIPRMRLLLDFPEDLRLMNVILGTLGSDCTLRQVKELWLNNERIQSINSMPHVTIYTCAYNAEHWIEKCMGSVASQENFGSHEYLLIDDCSSDRTALLMAKFAELYPNVKYIRNPSNLGLAASSNVALNHARGEFVVRLDADDYFTADNAISDLVDAANRLDVEAVYPANYHGSKKYIQRGEECNHAGGALFRTRAINFIKFTDGLRHHDSLDLFARAKVKLKIGYLERAIFMYRQNRDSMSKSDPAQREYVRGRIMAEGITTAAAMPFGVAHSGQMVTMADLNECPFKFGDET